MPPRKPKLSPSAVPVEAITHADKRANLPTADVYEFVAPEVEKPQQVRYPRDPSLDPQLVWKGKDAQDSEDLGSGGSSNLHPGEDRPTSDN